MSRHTSFTSERAALSESATSEVIDNMEAFTISDSPLLSLPAEIRLEIYKYLLTPPEKKDFRELSTSHPVYHYWEQHPRTLSRDRRRTLHIRVQDPQHATDWARNTLPQLKRSKCLMRTDRFRARTMETTYLVHNNPGIETAIMSTCKLIHSEAAEVLYGGYTFDFDTHVEAIAAFVNDLTNVAKTQVRSVGLVKRAIPYDREFDRSEWDDATESLSSLSSLQCLELGVVAGKPGSDGWDDVPTMSKIDFAAMAKWRDWAGLEWVKEIARVRVMKGGEVRVKAIVEHCPPPQGSEGMAFWVGLSKNVEGGFGDWIRDLIVA